MLFTAIGVYFHPYVLFTIIIGLVFIFGEYVIRKENLQYWLIIKNGIPGFIISSVFLFAIYLPGYLFFNANQSFSSDLNFNLTSVLQGFGLTAIRGGTNLASIGLWHILLMFGTIGGLLLVVAKWREYRQVLYLVFAFLAQFCIIVCLDVYKHYFFSPRQTIHLTLIIFQTHNYAKLR